jgi:hypothetical protein
MKASNVSPGIVVETHSYGALTPKDTSGAASYKIVTESDYGGIPADGSGDHVLDNGNVAILIKDSKEQDATKFGIKAQAGFDNADLITEAAKGNDLYMPRKSGTYEAGQVVPTINFNLDAGFSSLKLTSKTHPLFFDNSLEVKNDTFVLRNAKIDLNKDNVTFGNLAGGCVWLGKGNDAGSPLEWDTVIIENVDCVNSYRVNLNFLSIDRVFVKNYSLLNGGIAGSGLFSYGGTTENCRKVVLEDIIVRNTYGFGWHLYRCDYVDACNVEFTNLTKDGSAIGFTLTESKKVHIRNHVAQTDGDALEINACQDVIVENFDVNGGNRGLLLGDNGTGIDNQRITLRNGVVTGGGSFSAAINYCHKLLCEDVRFNGPISVITAQGDRASDLRFKACQIAQNINGSLSDRRFIHEQTRFLDCVYSQNENTFEMMDTGGVDLAQDEYIVIPIKPVLNKTTVFYVEVYGEFISAGSEQMGWRRYQCVYKGVADANLNDLLITLEDEENGSIAARYLTLEVVGGEMRATNKGAITINGNFWLHGVRRTRAKDRPFP